ncbi:hypothetical protein MRB53_022844 [Persea americana]|uniref:Uncharacterized protein n=1 Tax=Persea americana TaxID=3435 RepID=A0ACC2L7X4_PERAE|nr:hypothetical protein MRB53_022844 [Persea americana]
MHICKAALSDDANMVVVIYGLGHSTFCRIGDKVWNEIEDSTFMEDVIYHNGQFYSLSQSICLHLLRIEDGVNPWWEDLTEHLQRPGVFYLVPDIFTDSMFMIIRRMSYMDEKDDEEDEEDSDEEDEENEEYSKSPPSRHITNHFEIYKTPVGEEAPNKKLKNKMTKQLIQDTEKLVKGVRTVWS